MPPETDPTEERVLVLNRQSGVLGSISRSKLEAALSTGNYSVPDDETVANIRHRESLVDEAPEKAEAFVEGALSELTLGGSDYLVSKVASEEELAKIRIRRESGAATAGSIFGGVSGALAGGLGAGLGAKVALREAAKEGVEQTVKRSAGAKLAAAATSGLSATPLGLVSRGSAAVGAAVERGVLGTGTAGIARQALARGTGFAAEGALSGAAVGAGQSLSEASLGGEEITAQKLLAGAGDGAVFGGLLGGGLGAVSGVGSALLRRGHSGLSSLRALEDGSPVAGLLDEAAGAADAGKAASAATGHVAPDIAQSVDGGFASKAKDLYSKVSAKFSDKPAEEIAWALDNKTARSNWMQRDRLVEEATKRAVAGMDELKSLEQFERRLGAGDFKADNVAKFIKTGDGEAERQLYNVERLHNEIVGKLERSDVAALVGADNAGQLAAIAKNTDKALRAAAKADNPPAAAYLAIEDMKRGMQELHKRSIDAMSGPQKPLPRQATELAHLKNFTEIYSGKAKALLEDSQIWGQAGSNQASRNAAFRDYINTAGDFEGRFFKKLKERSPDGRRIQQADGEKAKRYFDSLADWRKDHAHTSTLRHLDARAKFYDVLEKNGEVPSSLAGEFSKAKATVAKLRADMQRMGEVISDANRIRDLAHSDALSRMVGGPVRGASGALLGSVLGGPLGAAAGVAVDALRNPGALIQKIAAVESLAGRVARVDDKVRLGLRRYISDQSDPSLRRLPAREARRKARSASAAASGGLTIDRSLESRRASVAARVRHVEEYRANPVVATDAFVRRSLRGLGDYAPGVTASLVQTHQRAMEFLAAKLPPAPIGALMSLQPQLADRTLAPSQIMQLAKYFDAVDNPISVVEDLRTGHLSTEAVEAVKAVYPDLWSSMRTVAIEEVASSREKLTYTSVVRMSLLFDFVGDPTLSSGFISAHQQALQQSEQQAEQAAPTPSNRKTPDVSSSSLTVSERIAQSI